MEKKYNKVLLAYSGGLDTSIIIPWLKDHYGCEVVAVAADVGQEAELDGLEEKAVKTGASKLYIEDLKEELVNDVIFPSLKAGAVYEGKYLLGTAFARPIIGKRLVEIAKKENVDAIVPLENLGTQIQGRGDRLCDCQKRAYQTDQGDQLLQG